MRDHFNDNIYDVNTVGDILNQKSINILEKKENHLIFEFGNDFFKLEEGKLLQYPDFSSARSNRNYKDATFIDYGLAITDAVTNSDEIKSLNEYSLKDRDNYIKENLNGGFLTVPFKLDRNIEKTANQIKGISSSKAQEMKDISALTNAVIDVIALMFNFYKAIKIKNSKTKVIDDILLKLNQKNANSIVRDYDLLREIPEIKGILQKYDKFSEDIIVDKDFSDFNQRLNAVQELASTALGDEELLKTCEKISDSEFFQKNLEDAKLKIYNISEQLNEKLPSFREQLLENKEHNLDCLKNLHNEGFVKFFVNDLGLNPKNKSDNLEFLLANNFFSRELLGQTSEDYDYSIMRFISNAKDLDNINLGNVTFLVEKIGDSLLGLDIKQEQTNKITI